MKKLKLIRLEETQEQTLGYLFDGLEKLACTLELAYKENKFQISSIPKGNYCVKRRWSQKYGNHFHILDVPNRDYILIHAGNYYTQILGCVLVGNHHVDINKDGYKDVTSSKNTMKKLIDSLPNDFELEIV